jgi:hypothetical protein
MSVRHSQSHTQNAEASQDHFFDSSAAEYIRAITDGMITAAERRKGSDKFKIDRSARTLLK